MRNIFLAGILTISGLLCSGLSTFAQQKMPDGCTVVRGQIVCPPAQQTTPNRCAEGGPLIIKLNSSGTFYERSIGYLGLDEILKCRGLNTGFFGAASDVTWAFYVDEKLKIYTLGLAGGFSDKVDAVLRLASNQLVPLNTSEFAEIMSTGKLAVTDGRLVAYLTDPVAIDFELVRREQIVVENVLLQTGNYRNPIVTTINARINVNLDYARYIQAPLSPTMKAIAQVRDNKRSALS